MPVALRAVGPAVDNHVKTMEPRHHPISRINLTVFFAFLLFYLSLSPFSISGMGYELENMTVCSELFENLKHFIGRAPAYVPLVMPRHGIFEAILQLPFYSVAHLLGGGDLTVDRVLSLEPVIETSLICTILFIWVGELTGSLRWAYVLAIAAGLTTMLWPYAYIGLETSQALFLFLAAYMALASRRRSVTHTILFILVASLAVSIKTAGVFLLPAIIFVGVVYVRRLAPSARTLCFLTFACAIALCCITCSTLAAISPQYIGYGGRAGFARRFAVPPTVAVFNLISMITSANKGFLIYCPVLIIAFVGVKAAYKANSGLTLFALLAFGGIALGLSCTIFWADEVWGPRYLLSAVPPLIMMIAAGKIEVEFRLRRQLGIFVLMIFGLGISFLGSFYSYHLLHEVGTRAGPIPLEQIQTGSQWNPIRFDLQLLRVWIHSRLGNADYDQSWPPASHQWTTLFPSGDASKPVRLRPFAVAQPFLFQGFPGWTLRPELFLWLGSAVALVLGLALFWRNCHLCFQLSALTNPTITSSGTEPQKTPV